MEAKFFSEIEKNIKVKTLKGFEKELRNKIYNEMETLRSKNDDLNKILTEVEREVWSKIRNEEYSWLQLDSNKKKKFYRLIDIYFYCRDMIDSVRDVNEKVEKLKRLKDAPVDSE